MSVYRDFVYQNMWDEDTGETWSVPRIGGDYGVYQDSAIHWYFSVREPTREEILKYFRENKEFYDIKKEDKL